MGSGWNTVPICAEAERFAARSASRTRGFAAAGHHPSATRHLRVTSTENAFSAWYVAFSLRTSASHRSYLWPIPDNTPFLCLSEASSVLCSSSVRAVTSEFI